jgi:hypothetical protein
LRFPRAAKLRKGGGPRWKWFTNISSARNSGVASTSSLKNSPYMQQGLDRERKAMIRIWAKREEQLKSVLDSSGGLYVDLQGIAGRSLSEIEGLDFLTIGDMVGYE